MCRLSFLVYCFYSCYCVSELLLEDGFDPALNGSLCVRAACAVSLQLYEYDLVIVGIIYEFNIASVSLKEGSDLLKYAYDLFFHFLIPFCPVWLCIQFRANH